MGDNISIVADSQAVPTSTSAPSVKQTKRFGRSLTQSTASVSHSPTLSKSFSLSKISKNRKKIPTSPSAISSILNGMYAHPTTRPPRHLSSQDPGPSKTPFLYRKVARPLTAMSAESSSNATDNAINIRARTFSENSVFSSIAEQSLQSMAVLHTDVPEEPTTSMSSLESTPSGRLVGRGGIGSRPRVVATKNIVIPVLQSLEDVMSSGSPHVTLRPSGRGGLASRPKQLAPPPPPPPPLTLRSPPADKQGPSLHMIATNSTPTFVRPGGRGGIGAHASSASPPLTLKDILNRKKRKSAKKAQAQAQARTITTFQHPSNLTYEISNASHETLSTLHFAGESTSPPPSFFHEREHQQSIQSASADDLSLTPPCSATASTFEGSLSPETEEDDLDVSIYLEDEPSRMSPQDRRKRSINKLMRTFGDNPYDPTSGALTHLTAPAHSNGSLPKIIVDGGDVHKHKTTKMFRRASISVSLFGRPARTWDADGLDSQSTIDTITDDLHRLGLGDDDNMSESWGAIDTSRMSAFGAPGSPIVFSPPSPPLPQTEPKSKAALSAPSPDSDDEEISVPSSTLSRSQSYSHSSRRQSTRISHNHSMSTSLANHAFSEKGSSVASSVNWLFPPSSDDRDFKLLVTSNKHPEKPLEWTGEWNTDMHDVIRALRELR